MNINVNFNVLLSKYIVHPLVKIKKDFDKICYIYGYKGNSLDELYWLGVGRGSNTNQLKGV